MELTLRKLIGNFGFLLATTLLLFPLGVLATLPPQSPPNIGINGYLSVDRAQRGRTVQAAVVMDIPSGYHVNSSKPSEKYLIATQLQLEAPKGIRLGPVMYPRAVLRNLKFSKAKLSVYEGRAILRFNVNVPADFGSGAAELRARLRYQSCNDELCFPPQTREIILPVTIVGGNESVKRINGEYFSGGGRKG